MGQSGHKHQHQRGLLGGSLHRAAACSIWWFIGSRSKQSDQQPKREVEAEHVCEPFEPTNHHTRPLNLQYFIIRIGLQLFFILELCENLHRGRTFPKQSRARKMGSFVSCNVNFEHAFKAICDDDDQNYPNRRVRPFKMRPLALSFFLTLFEKCAFARKQPIVRDGPHSKLFTPMRARTSH